MTSSDYHFITHWRVQSTVQEITEILRNGVDLVRWWPSVYLEIRELSPGDERGLGYTMGLYTKGWLPYTLRWQARSVEVNHPYGFAIRASGDFVGRGEWTFTQEGEWVDITYDWRIRADKPFLKYGGFLFKPIFRMNHIWAMEMGEESLKLELQRRHALTQEDARRIPEPPGPLNTSPVPFVLGSVGAVALVLALAYALRNRSK